MTHRLHVAPVHSVSRLRGALSPGEAAEYGEYDDEILEVDSIEGARRLVETCHNVSWADAEPAAEETDSDTDEDAEPAAEFDATAFVDRTPMSVVIEDLETGDYDTHLDAIEAAAERVGVQDAIEERRDT